MTIMDNKFGLFVHWGLYSIRGIQEQEIARCNKDHQEYEKYINLFNPEKYNAEEIVLLAKNAGMKYICITTKHHDGFCMWDTKYTDYNIMNTPYGKDVIKMLAEACEKHGMLLSFYYSCPDWHHEYGYNSKSTHQWKAVNKEKEDFKKYKEYVVNQITELLTGYGKIYTFFWDIPPMIEDRSINELVRKLQPGIYINDRGFDKGDFSTPERDQKGMIEKSRFVRMTEACNSVGEQSWGYRENEDYNSIRYLTMTIDHVMAMGGSYLLNIGPKADGSIDKTQKEIIERVGKWYQAMEGSLENTETDPFDYQIRKHPCIVNRKNGKSYFNFYEGITSSAISMNNYPSVPKRVRLLNTGKELPFKEELMPGFFDMKTGYAKKHLHIQNIPINSLESEPIVLEVEW
jgi:alpha-L-fucosidase